MEGRPLPESCDPTPKYCIFTFTVHFHDFIERSIYLPIEETRQQYGFLWK